MVIYAFFPLIVASRWNALLEKRPPQVSVDARGSYGQCTKPCDCFVVKVSLMMRYYKNLEIEFQKPKMYC